MSIRRVVKRASSITQLGVAGSAEPGVVLTFDDGTHDFCDIVVPELVEVGLPATLYLATGFVDTGRASPWGVGSVS